ncbi:MAG TPA: hypothetical protein VK510_04295, partial [Solirubrobacteraceae bacterium]|nr:hypothetical protein [Solirubrobacteraceae bacterium]
MYLKAGARLDRRGVTEHRRRLLQGVSGRVVEVGAGNGLNFAHYPPTATEVVAIEPEPDAFEPARSSPACRTSSVSPVGRRRAERRAPHRLRAGMGQAGAGL